MATSPLASPGIGSGLDINAIVEKLMSIERKPLDAIAKQQAAFQSKISAYGALKSALAALQTALDGLGTNAFRSMTATLSDTSLASVAAGSGAAAGTHSIEVAALAQAHRIASVGFASASDTVGSGTLTFTFGTWAAGVFAANPEAATGTVTIGADQSSLAGIRDAVNAAKIGVAASIVDDGSAAGQRLVFTSSSGAAMSLKVGVADDDGNALDAAGLSQLAYDPAAAAGAGRNMAEKVVAQDAALKIDGIDIVKPTNVVSDALEGVTITLAKTNVGAPATLNVFAGTGAGLAAMDAFVKAYNDVHKTIGNLTRYDSEKRQASVLTGDATVRMVQGQLRSLIGGAISGAAGASELATLAQAGIRTQADGTLSFDAAKFSALLASDPVAVERLFAAVGSASDSLVKYKASDSKTQPGDYAVAVSQLATRGTLAGNAAAGLTITAGVNDALTATIDGVAVTVTLGAQTYASASALAAEVAARLNGAKPLKDAGSSVSVTASGGVLTLTSARYGASSKVALAGSAAANLLGGAPVATDGIDVAGSIGGVAATGSGQTLSGATGSAAEGLKLDVLGGLLGARGSVKFTRGIAAMLDRALEDLLDDEGVFDARTDGVQASLTQLDRRKTALEERLERVEAAYRAQYVALDSRIAQLSATSSYLAQQLANLPKIGSDE
jgi:flagellar hook-associated protein 2